MTLPIHTVKHVKAEYRKYQVIAVLFAAIALSSALLAAVSGIQLAKLRKNETRALKSAAENPPVDPTLVKEMKELKSDLAAEKAKSNKLNATVSNLQKKLTAAKKRKPRPAPKPAPIQPEPDTVKDSAQPSSVVTPAPAAAETQPVQPAPPAGDASPKPAQPAQQAPESPATPQTPESNTSLSPDSATTPDTDGEPAPATPEQPLPEETLPTAQEQPAEEQ